MNPILTEMKEWLQLNACRCVRPVLVHFGTARKGETESREGCLYRRTLCYTAGTSAVTRGDAKVGDTYVESSCYLLGNRPKAVLPGAPRPTKSCFRTLVGDRDWYVACWIEVGSITERIKQYHPFGPSFIIKPWLCADPIDAYEFHPRYHTKHVPYTRYSLTFDLDAPYGR